MQVCTTEEALLKAYNELTDPKQLIIANYRLVETVDRLTREMLLPLIQKYSITVSPDTKSLLSILVSENDDDLFSYSLKTVKIPDTDLCFVQYHYFNDDCGFEIDYFDETYAVDSIYLLTKPDGSWLEIATEQQYGSRIPGIVVEFQFALLYKNAIVKTMTAYHSSGSLLTESLAVITAKRDMVSDILKHQLPTKLETLPRTVERDGVFLLEAKVHFIAPVAVPWTIKTHFISKDQ